MDNGHTTLLSPLFDLSGVGPAVLSYARWFADATVLDDALGVSISNDGRHELGAAGDGDRQPERVDTAELRGHAIPAADGSDAAALRAADEPNNSLVEAGVDDLEVDVFDGGPAHQPLRPADAGQHLALNVSGQAGDVCTWYVSPATGFVQVPSIDGPLLLDPGLLIPLFAGGVPANGLSSVVAQIPVNPALSGLTVYFQASCCARARSS